MITERRPLLIVEDSDEDFKVAEWSLYRTDFNAPILRCTTGDEALDFFAQGQADDPDWKGRPGLIVLDLNLPGIDGRDVLRTLKTDPRLRAIPIVVFSTSTNPVDVDACYEAGANAYMTKPVDFQRFRNCWETLVHYWFDLALLPTPP
ncbi:MAG: response regulator [Chloroflexota bacterium]